VLAPGQFLAAAVLSDRQRRRQEVYREFLKRPPGGRSDSRDFLLAWAKPLDMHFTLAPEARTVGDALLVIPVRWERPAPGARISIPGPLVACRRILDGRSVRPSLEGSQGIDMHLRFQLPTEALPLKVEQARLSVKIDAPLRRVSISGQTDGGLVELRHVESPLDPIHVEIGEERYLRLDEHGGLHFHLSVGKENESSGPGSRDAKLNRKWTIDYVELEVVGRTE
jgi:hypothetical protein